MTSPRSRKPTGTRRDIQALRALAVGIVVLNHLWPHRMSGGYVGVDVFFVISGFLISTHLLKELNGTGRVRLGAFYARRIMRLLPAAFLVISVSAVATWRMLPYDQWTQNAKEFLAAALYSENWVLAARSINYSAQTQAETVIRHYWSLSVEEQFYLVWPLLLLIVTLIARRRSPRLARGLLIGTLSVVAVVFFAISVVVTANHPDQAYFITPTRMWEFAIGGLVAVLAPRIRMPRALAEILAIVGFAAIVYTSFSYGPTTPFPGSAAAVPVIGTALVIAAGTRRTPLFHEYLTGLRPIQFFGDISYSVYLWHWPFVVLVPAARHQDLGWRTKIAIIAVTVVLSWLTKVIVEDPGRRWAWPKARTWRAFATMAAGILVTGVVSLTLIPLANAQITHANEISKMVSEGACAGPKALGQKNCPDPFTMPVPNPVMTDANSFWNAPTGWCSVKAPSDFNADVETNCDDSQGDAGSPRVWVVGDSHAAEWLPAILRISKENHWNLTVALHMACPPVRGEYVQFLDHPTAKADLAKCTRWGQKVQNQIATAKPDAVITAAFLRHEVVSDGSAKTPEQQMVEALRRMWRPWLAQGTKVIPLVDPPINNDARNECIVTHANTPQDCAVPRASVQPTDPFVTAATGTSGVSPIDLTDMFCGTSDCYGGIGAMRVYYDTNHVNYDYMTLLTPFLSHQLKAVAPTLFQ